MQSKTFNKPAAARIRTTAKRTLKIIDLIEDGLKDKEIIAILADLRLGGERSLVNYYRQQLKN